MTLRRCRRERFASVQREWNLADRLELDMFLGTVATIGGGKMSGTEVMAVRNSLDRRCSRRMPRYFAYFAENSDPKG